MSAYIFKLKNHGLSFELTNMGSKEKAIERFANCLPDDYSLSDFDVSEKEECPYCHEQGGDHRVKMLEDDPDGQAGLVLRKDGWYLWTADPFTFEMLYPISYCPMCGRDLRCD